MAVEKEDYYKVGEKALSGIGAEVARRTGEHVVSSATKRGVAGVAAAVAAKKAAGEASGVAMARASHAALGGIGQATLRAKFVGAGAGVVVDPLINVWRIRRSGEQLTFDNVADATGRGLVSGGSGMLVGAAVGSVVPVFGTILGALAGSAVSYLVGRSLED